MMKILTTTSILLALAVVPARAQQSSIIELLNQETSVSLKLFLEEGEREPLSLARVARLLAHEQILNLYQQRDYSPIWIAGWQLKPEVETLLEQLRDASSHGLCGNDYRLHELERLLHVYRDFAGRNLPLAPDNRAVLDLFLSQAFLTYATHMVEGQVDPALAHVDWRARRRKANLIKLLEYAVDNNRLSQVLQDLIPPHQEYHQLAQKLADYQLIAAHGGWPEIPVGPAIKPGDRDRRIPLVSALLLKTGDIADIEAPAKLYESHLVEAVRNFQSRHGLVDDGVIGAKTRKAMNVTVEERIRQIELNLERWRWMPKSFGKKHIRVNVADFSLVVVEDGEPVMQMPVIVGTRYRKTPVFSARMSYLEFAPYWTVPPTILREDKLPKIKQDPGYLEEKHFNIISRHSENVVIDPSIIDWSSVEAANFPGLLRMDPGPWNPLGRVKFMFPNRFNVYLHDTNEGHLFGSNVRSFSSGCIRVERPRELASYLLANDLGEARLEELFAATEPVQIPIKPLPVHIQYWTAWVDSESQLHFRRDVYYRDLDLDVALTEPAYRVMEQLQVNDPGAGQQEFRKLKDKS